MHLSFDTLEVTDALNGVFVFVPRNHPDLLLYTEGNSSVQGDFAQLLDRLTLSGRHALLNFWDNLTHSASPLRNCGGNSAEHQLVQALERGELCVFQVASGLETALKTHSPSTSAASNSTTAAANDTPRQQTQQASTAQEQQVAARTAEEEGAVVPGDEAGNLSKITESDNKLVLDNGTSGFSQLSSQSRRYLNDLETQTGFKVTADQRTNLASTLREQEFTKLSPEMAKTHRAQFNRVKDDLITQWERNTGQEWPRYTENVLAKDGVTVARKAGQPFDAHHIIESSYGGPNRWWNMHPARFPDQHQGGIHRSGSIAREIFSGS